MSGPTDHIDLPDENGREYAAGIWVLRRIAIVFAGLYPVFVVALAVVKIAFNPPRPWAEVLYGPAITLVSMWIIIALGTWIGWLCFQNRK
jgi:hypothetical protein